MSESLPAPRRLLPLAEVMDRVGLRKTAIYERIAHGEFPKPVQLGTTVWITRRLGSGAGIGRCWRDHRAAVADPRQSGWGALLGRGSLTPSR